MNQAARKLAQLAACSVALVLAIQSYSNGAACDWLAAGLNGFTALAVLAVVDPFTAAR